MLTCKDFLTWLNDVLDDTADDGVRREVQSHVDACPNCWVIFDTTKRTLQVYKGMDPVSLPGGVHSRLMDAVTRRIGQRQPSKPPAP